MISKGQNPGQSFNGPGQTFNGQGVRRISRFQLDREIKIATWNVRTLFAAGKLQNLIQEMERMKISILGVSEVRWPDSGMVRSNGKVFYYSGSTAAVRNHRNGVGLLIDESLGKSIRCFLPISERVMLVQLAGSPININIIQVYAPTADGTNEDIEKFYKHIDEALKVTKKHEINVILGDFNAKIGKGRVKNIVGEHGLGIRNERGEWLMEYCEEKDLVVTNTWYQLPPRRLYTWRSPQDNDNHIVRNQIDYILINRRFRNTITKTTTLPGADIESDHNPLCANVKLRLSKSKKKKATKRIDPKLLKDADTKSSFEQHLNDQLTNSSNSEDVEEMWSSIKESFKTANNAFLLQPRVTAKNEWMTENILQLMENRRKCKVSGDRDGYTSYQRGVRNEIRLAKEKWLTERCEEAENFVRLGDSFHLHKKVKEIAGIYNKRPTTTLRNDQNEPIIDPDELQETWKSYVSSLFSDDRTQSTPEVINNIPEGPSILESEVRYAMKLMKNNKAPGPDDMYAETIHMLNENNMKKLVKLFNIIYDTGQLPKDWLRSTFITLPKTANAKLCRDYRLISLMSHFLKLFLRILHTRLYKKCEAASGYSQFGFKNGFGTREAIFSLQTLVQNCLDRGRDVFMVFIDYEKAFDNVKHDLLIRYMQDLGLDNKDIRIIANLYWNQTAEVRLQNFKTTEDIEIKKGVRQGCILSPMLFNLYVERAFAEVMSMCTIGIRVNGIPINNIRYADDTVILADNADDLQALLHMVQEKSEHLGLKINSKKTKFMVVSKNNIPATPLYLNGILIEEVTKFKYLGCLVTNRWDPEVEIRSRIEQARSTFLKLKKFLTNNDLSFQLRYRMVKCYVWSVLLYGVEAWTLKVTSINRLEAFEMWTLRRMFRIPWTDLVRNEEVLGKAGLTSRELFDAIKKRKTSYLGHILRGPRYEFQRLILQGKIEGKRGIGRKKLSWLRNIRQWTGIHDFMSLQNAALNREI